MANNAEGFKAPQCEKQAGLWETAAQKIACSKSPSGSDCTAALFRNPHRRLRTAISNALFHLGDGAANAAATNSTNFASVWRLSRQQQAVSALPTVNNLLCPAQMTHTGTAVAQAERRRVTQDFLVTCERCTLVAR
jgi:hypothetical protein